MKIRRGRIVVSAGAIGFVAVVALVVASQLRSSPGGTGENLEWLLSYSLLLGFPVSLLASLLRPLGSPLVIRVALLITVPLNWGLWAFALASVMSFFQQSKGTKVEG